MNNPNVRVYVTFLPYAYITTNVLLFLG